ncbi:MAG: hypothetical protein ACKVPY_00415 [Paracoccaceae bacterium]
MTAPAYAAPASAPAADRAARVFSGAAMIALAIGFNLPFARLAAIFDYPGILRRPAGDILATFAAGGPELILTWYAFSLAAILFVPVTLAHSLAAGRIARFPALAVAAALFGALAGLTQAIGLLRWVTVVPGLAADPQGASIFAGIHAYGGMAIGEHLGQIFTAMFAGTTAALQLREGHKVTAALGALTAAVIATGAYEGVALVIGAEGAVFGFAAVAGYALLSLWMIASGVGLIRR